MIDAIVYLLVGAVVGFCISRASETTSEEVLEKDMWLDESRTVHFSREAKMEADIEVNREWIQNLQNAVNELQVNRDDE